MAGQMTLPNFSLELHGDMKLNWEHFCETFEAYVTLMGYRPGSPAKELAALKYALPKETRTVLKTSIKWAEGEDQLDPVLTLAKLGKYYAGTKNIIHERVQFNRMRRGETDSMAKWETMCREQGTKCEYCGDCTPEIIRDRFIVGINDDTLMANLVNRAVKDNNISLESVVLQAQQYEATKTRVQSLTMSNTEEQVNFVKDQRSKTKKHHPFKANTCPWCGDSPHPNGKESCPAKGKQCFACGRWDHLGKVCLHPNPSWRQQRGPPVDSRSSGRKQDTVRYVDTTETDTFQADNFCIDTVYTNASTEQGRGKKYFAHLDVMPPSTGKVTTIKFQIDSGATCNVIPKQYLQQLSHPPLQQSTSIMSMYNSNHVKPLGVLHLECRKNGHSHSLTFQVVDGEQFAGKPPLLCGSDCEKLQLLTISADEVNVIEKVSLSEAMIKEKYHDVFHGLGCIGDPVHIQLDANIRPIQAGLRRYPVNKVPAISKRIREMIDEGYLASVTEPTPWCSPMLAVDRPGKKMRICMDPVRTLNQAIKRPLYPMPTLEENLHRLVGAKRFTLVDALVGFTQVALDDESSLMTTMHTPIGRVKWLRLPFGISSAPEEFQRRQRDVLEGLKGVINIADDILIFGSGETQQEADNDHDRNLIDLLERCREKNLKLNPDKLKFRSQELPFMGHKITTEGLKPDESKIEAIVNMPVPADKKAVLRFLGMCNFIAQYIPQLSEACVPLREISNPSSEFSWSSTQQAAFDEIKQKVAKACSLQYFNPEVPVTLQVDASDYGIGAALLQQGRPVAYSSTTLSKAEKDNYAQIEKECLAIVHALTRWDQWLYGHHHIIVESDHKPLETIFKHPVSHAPKRLQKMMLRLQRYSFTVVHRKGSTMWLADTLSRAPLPRKLRPDANFEVFVTENIETITKPDRITDHTYSVIQQATERDPILSHLIPYIQHGWPRSKEEMEKNLATFWSYRWELTYTDGVLYKGNKIIVPAAMRRRMLEKIHSAHQGIEKSILNATDTMFWPSMRADIKEACEKCATCAQYANRHQPEPMLHHPIPDLPWQFVSQDIFQHGSQRYLVTVDHYSDFFEVDVLEDTLASTIVSCTKKIFARHGVPMVCLTDNGPQFIAAEFNQFSKEWGFKHITSSPYHSQGNGRAEAAVKAAKNILKKCNDPQLGLLHLRNTATKGHNTSPAQRLMSRRTRTSVPISTTLLHPELVDPGQVKEEMTSQRQVSKYIYDKNSAPDLPVLTTGDYVYFRPPPNKQNFPWQYGKVIDNPSPRSYTIKTSNGMARRNRSQIRLAAPPAHTANAPAYSEVTDSTPEFGPVTPSPPPRESAQEASVDTLHPTTPTEHTPPPSPAKPQPVKTPIHPSEASGAPYRTRSGRPVRPPQKFE